MNEATPPVSKPKRPAAGFAPDPKRQCAFGPAQVQPVCSAQPVWEVVHTIRGPVSVAVESPMDYIPGCSTHVNAQCAMADGGGEQPMGGHLGASQSAPQKSHFMAFPTGSAAQAGPVNPVEYGASMGQEMLQAGGSLVVCPDREAPAHQPTVSVQSYGAHMYAVDEDEWSW